MKANKLCTFLLLGIVLLNGSLCRIAYTASEQETFALVQKILSDPMLPDAFREAKISENTKHKSTKEESGNSYKLIAPDKTDVGSLSISERSSDVYDFGLYFYNLMDTTSAIPIANWETMMPKWDAFVARYWPGLHRTSDWKNEIWRRSGSGTFTMQYALEKQKLEVFKVILDVRLEDGKISAVSTMDFRGLLKNIDISPPPSNEQIISAVRDALKEKQHPATTDLTSAKMSIDDVRRWALPTPDMGTQILDSGNINVVDAKGDTYIVTFDYAEKHQKAGIQNITTQKELDEFRQKPLTQIDDKEPSWSADGKQLYFITSRRAEDQPWWTPVVFQYAIAVNQVKRDNIQYISPLKIKNGDYGLYSFPFISPDKRYLALGIGRGEKKENLSILDLDKGTLFVPEINGGYANRFIEKHDFPEPVNERFRANPKNFNKKGDWVINSVQWLSDGSFLFSGRMGRRRGIYLMRKTSDYGKTWDRWDIQMGNNALISLSADEKVLSWAHQDAPPTFAQREKGDNAPRPWQFVTADFDPQQAELNNLIKVDLPDKPTSISWDSRNERWLIVTEKNELYWVTKSGEQLTAIKVLLSLTWDDNKLRPSSAAISPDGKRIAVAAQLEEPVIYDETNAAVHSMIFNWDGKSTSVQPFFDPSINGVKRYSFPKNNQSWAIVDGHTNRWNLENNLDTEFVKSKKGK